MNDQKPTTTLQKILLTLFSLPVSVFLSLFVFGLLADLANNKLSINPVEYTDRVWIYTLFTIIFPAIVALSIFVAIFIAVFKITKKFPMLTISTVFFVVFGAFFLFKPYKIAGGNVGPYLNGQIVLTTSRILFRQPLKAGQVVVFKRDALSDGIGYIVAIPGASFQDAYTQPNQKLAGDIVPVDTYLVRFGEGRFLWAITNNQIINLVWFPIIK